jgi:addiction module HigA family antidote
MLCNRKNEYRPQSVTHPGVTLKAKIEEMQMSISDFAKRACLSEDTIAALTDGKISITTDIANALQAATNIPASFWMNRQKNYN